MTKAYEFSEGTLPLLVSMPHVGTRLTTAVRDGLVDDAMALPDTDWHLARLYDFAWEMGASVIEANYSRYVIDLNRSRDNVPLYAGATTGLYPETLFTGAPLFKPGATPSDAERQRYLEEIWDPYHQRIQRELAKMISHHGYALLFEAHSIKSHIPFLFEGTLPNFSFGTNSGASCDPGMEKAISAVMGRQEQFSSVFNGRFKGGYITRAYGWPDEQIHAVQLELGLSSYMEDQLPYQFGNGSTAACQALIKGVFEAMLTWAQQRYSARLEA